MIIVQGLVRDFRTADRAVAALAGVDLSIADGTFTVLLGPSGSGKTTLLRCIAGLETPDAGEISISGETVFSTAPKRIVPPEQRRLGMVFQSYAVWPHLTVEQNVGLPLTHGSNRVRREDRSSRIERALRAVKLEAFASRPTTMLSGGQQQRVALARALAIEPRALLMDEPLSNLDARLREEIRAQIKATARQFGVTVLYVTHDQEEAMALADRIAVMDMGSIIQVGSASELYHRPATARVAEFFGSINWIRGVVRDPGFVETALGVITTPAASFRGPVTLGIRPEDFRLSREDDAIGDGIAGRVVEQTFLGDFSTYQVQAGETQLAVKFAGDRGALEGVAVRCRVPEDRVLVFRTDAIESTEFGERGSVVA